MVGVHTWNSESQKPEGYILGYSLLSSGSGRDQAKADYHIIRKQFGITNVAGMVGDNAKTQTGHKSGVTPTYLTIQSIDIDAVKQVLVPRVIWIMHTSVSYITKLHGSIMKGQISTNQCICP